MVGCPLAARSVTTDGVRATSTVIISAASTKRRTRFANKVPTSLLGGPSRSMASTHNNGRTIRFQGAVGRATLCVAIIRVNVDVAFARGLVHRKGLCGGFFVKQKKASRS